MLYTIERLEGENMSISEYLFCQAMSLLSVVCIIYIMKQIILCVCNMRSSLKSWIETNTEGKNESNG